MTVKGFTCRNITGKKHLRFSVVIILLGKIDNLILPKNFMNF